MLLLKRCRDGVLGKCITRIRADERQPLRFVMYKNIFNLQMLLLNVCRDGVWCDVVTRIRADERQPLRFAIIFLTFHRSDIKKA